MLFQRKQLFPRKPKIERPSHKTEDNPIKEFVVWIGNSPESGLLFEQTTVGRTILHNIIVEGKRHGEVPVLVTIKEGDNVVWSFEKSFVLAQTALDIHVGRELHRNTDIIVSVPPTEGEPILRNIKVTINKQRVGLSG